MLKELIAQETVRHHTLSLVVTQSEHAAWIAGTILISTFYPSILVTQRSVSVWATNDRSPDVRRREERGIPSFSPWF